MMVEKANYPERCQRCRKLTEPRIPDHCSSCRRFGYSEEILCHLNRSDQDREAFQCFSFLPMLKLVSIDGEDSSGFPPAPPAERAGTLDQDKLQHVKEIALEHLRYRDATLFSDFKYHLIWNVTHRKSVFTIDPDTFTLVSSAFAGFGKKKGLFADMCYLAGDHVHVYLSYDGRRSLETVVTDMKAFTHRHIMGKYTYIRQRLGPEIDLWDKPFLVREVG